MFRPRRVAAAAAAALCTLEIMNERSDKAGEERERVTTARVCK